MVKSDEESKNKYAKRKFNLEDSLVLSIDQDKKIIKFNKECEKIIGYNKNDVLNKQFFDFLVPPRYQKQWKKLFKTMKKEKLIDDFKLPIQTKQGHEIMISWSAFPVKNSDGVIGDIGFVGKLIKTWQDTEEPTIQDSEKIIEKPNQFIDIEEDIKDLAKINYELERRNKELEQELKTLKKQKTKYHTNEDITSETHEHHPLGKSLYSLSDIVGGKKKKEELVRIMNELEEKRKLLNERETQLINEKKTINERRNEFCKWREKLETLEEELSKRELSIKQREENLKSAILAGSEKSRLNQTSETEELVEPTDFLDSIAESAIVLQRGILKQANESFIDLLGYKNEEVLNKSVFDFVAPEGFQNLESYYLKRIKGENISSYETVLLTKDNYLLNVEISNRPTTYNGEKADIAVIKKLKKLKNK